jgi:hypothetical protein
MVGSSRETNLNAFLAELTNGAIKNRAKCAGRSWPILWHYIDPILDRLSELGHCAYPFGLATTNDVFNAPNQDINDIIAITLLVHYSIICHFITTFYVLLLCLSMIKYDRVGINFKAGFGDVKRAS